MEKEVEYLLLPFDAVDIIDDLLVSLDSMNIYSDFIESGDIVIDGQGVLICADSLLYVALMLNEMALIAKNSADIQFLINFSCDILSAMAQRVESQAISDHWLNTNITSRAINATAH